MSAYSTYPGPGRCPHHKHKWLVYALDEDAWLCQVCAQDGEPVYTGAEMTEAMQMALDDLEARERAQRLAEKTAAERKARARSD